MWPLLPGASLPRREVWVEQPHGGVEMHETGKMLDDLLLQMAHDPTQLGSLPAQSVNNVRLGPCNPPSWIKLQDGNRMTSPLGTRPWWRLLHDAGPISHRTRKTQGAVTRPGNVNSASAVTRH